MLQRNFKPITLNAFRSLVLGATIGLLLAPGGARLQACGDDKCTEPSVCGDAVGNPPSGTSDLVVLEYSHKNGTWKLRRWTKSGGVWSPTGTSMKEQLETLVGNKAKIRLCKEDMKKDTKNFRVFLTETNPLLYTFSQTAASESLTADVQDLQGFLSILGGTLGTVVGRKEEADQEKLKTLSSSRDVLAAQAEKLAEARTQIRLAVQLAELDQASEGDQEFKLSDQGLKDLLKLDPRFKINNQLVKNDSPGSLIRNTRSAISEFRKAKDAIGLLANSRGPRLNLETIGTAKKAHDEAEAVLSATSAMENTAMQLAAFWTKLKKITPNGDDEHQCTLRNGVIELSRGNPKWKWNAVYDEEAKISLVKDELLKGIVPTRPVDLDVKYEIHPYRRTEFSLSFGLIYTEIVDPSWSAVTNPLDPATKVIARTDENSRAGQPTLLLTLHPFGLKEKRFSPGLDIGAGYSSGSAGAFLGLSVGLTDYLRLGAGWSWQEVSRLDHSQSELRYLDDGAVDPTSLTIVSGNDDILKRSHFDDNYYISLVFNFSGLQLFKPKDS